MAGESAEEKSKKKQRWSIVKKPGHPEVAVFISNKKVLDRRNIGCPAYLWMFYLLFKAVR